MNLKLIISILAILLIFAPVVSAGSNIAYVSKIKNLDLSSILEGNFEYEWISDEQIPFTDFSEYRVILLQGDVKYKDKIPFNTVNSIFFIEDTRPNYNVLLEVWPGASIGVSSAFTVGFDLSVPLNFKEGIAESEFDAYNIKANTIYYLDVKPVNVKKIIINSRGGSSYGKSIVAYSNQDDLKDVFFGLPVISDWSEETEKLFLNSVNWLIEGQCTDNDGDYYIAEKTEISICKNICGANKNENCLGNLDCNDTKKDVNPSSEDVFKNCKNDAPIIQSINIPVVSELKNLTITVSAVDPENDIMAYSINDSRFFVNGNTLTWKTNIGDAGNYDFLITVSDGKLSENKKISVTISTKNKAPVCNNIPELTWNEDETLNINLKNYCSDPEGKDIYFSVETKSGNININLDNGIAVFSSSQNWNGNGLVRFNVGDNEDITLTNNIILKVAPVNDAPVFNGNIPELSWKENTNLTDAIDLKDYFSDIDNELTFRVTGNSKVNVVIDNGKVRFYPQNNFFGQETITFIASDGQHEINSNSVLLNVLNNNKPPVFEELNCTTNILEDNVYSCELSATDFENDDINFSVANKNNLNCDVNGTILTYSSLKDYYGNANCLLKASDNRGSSNIMLNVGVENVNDAPIISDYSPKNLSKVMENANQRFYVIVSDIDSATNISWKLENETVETGNNFMFNKPAGNYNLTAVVSDGEHDVSKSWEVDVRTINDFTCSEASGFVCSSNEVCNGNILGVKDSNSCCNVACSEKPPEFSDIKRCEIKNSEIQITIDQPINNSEFKINDIINGKLLIKNKGNKDKNFYIETYLYDITKERAIEKNKENFIIIKNEEKTYNFKVDINEELNEDNKHAIYVKVYEKNNQSSCNDNYARIKIKREDYALRIEDIIIEPTALTCGDDAFAEIRIKNIGADSERGHLKLEVNKLKIEEQSEDFNLESDKTAMKNFVLHIPENSEKGEHVLRTSWISNDVNNPEIIFNQMISIAECRTEKTEQKLIETIHLNELQNLPVINEGIESDSWTLFFTLEGIILTGTLIVIFSMIIFKGKRQNKSSSGIGKAVIEEKTGTSGKRLGKRIKRVKKKKV